MRRAAVLVVGVLVAIVPAACSDDSSDDASSPQSSSTTPAAGTSKVSEGDTYVSVGSSLASGFGIANQSTEGCGRSDKSYAHLVATHFSLNLVDVSCGAATIPNVVDTPQGANPVQLDAVTPDTKLITIGLGGNDIGYNGTALACGDPATECAAPATLDADKAALQGDLEAMIAALKAKAPDATIVLVTYPREFPATNCPELSVTDTELDLLQGMGAAVEQASVGAARSTGVLLADPYVHAGDHTGCAPPSEQWAAPNKVTDGFAYHPTALGHQVMADLIIEELNR